MEGEEKVVCHPRKGGDDLKKDETRALNEVVCMRKSRADNSSLGETL